MGDLPKPVDEAMIYENSKLYACLANRPLTKGHVVVVWKDTVEDLHLLSQEDYEHLMEVVDMVRSAMLQALKVEKVYLMYFDETRHVHWHLVPRYNEKGVNVLLHEPRELEDTRLATKLQKKLEITST